MTGGKIKIANGKTVTVDQGMVMTGGTFATGATANLVGDLLVTGGTVDLAGLAAYGTLTVTGNVFFLGGEYDPDVNCAANSAQCDVWISTKDFYYSCAPSVEPVLALGDAGPEGRSWGVIKGNTGVMPYTDFLVTDLPYIPSGWSFAFTDNNKVLNVTKNS